MLHHEHFEELCAAASAGQATAEELVELERHCVQCNTCCQIYSDYLDLAARQFATAKHGPALPPQQADECLNSAQFTRRFFERVEQEGIAFSKDARHDFGRPFPSMELPSRKLRWWIPQSAIAAAAVIVLAVFLGYFYGKNASNRIPSLLQARNTNRRALVSSTHGLDERIAELTAANVKLRVQIDELNLELRRTQSRLRLTAADLRSASTDQQRIVSDRDALESQLKDAQKKLVESETAAVAAGLEASKLRDHAGDLDARLVADQIQIHDLTANLQDRSAALSQERQLLSLRHDVTDLMGARDLHIVDVVDTDTRGKKRPIFGRIFFTEGKSLVFYAYDLNEAKIEKTNYQYQIWAKKEGRETQVKRIGIFYSDDKAQRRWVFKCDNPKVLSDIDSVFVTLEAPDSNPSQPTGPNLMYAYLRGEPNHP